MIFMLAFSLISTVKFTKVIVAVEKERIVLVMFFSLWTTEDRVNNDEDGNFNSHLASSKYILSWR